MPEDGFCDKCSNKHVCTEVYERPGRYGGESVAKKSLFAFLLPLLVFAGCLAFFEWLFECCIESQVFLSLTAVLTAAAVSFAFIFLMKFLVNRKDR